MTALRKRGSCRGKGELAESRRKKKGGRKGAHLKDLYRERAELSQTVQTSE